MSIDLNKKRRDALESIRKATDFEDGRVGGSDNFVRLGDIGPGIGDVTLRYLLDHGLIEAGPATGSRRPGAKRSTSHGTRRPPHVAAS